MRREPTPEELEASRDARVAMQRLELAEMSVHYMEQAARLRGDAKLGDEPVLRELIKAGQDECLKLKGQVSGRIESRRRPRLGDGNRGGVTVFLDECGQHLVNAKDPFPVFVLGAAIVRNEQLEEVDRRWRQWKVDVLGDDVITHEPDIRYRRGAFFGDRGTRAIEDLPNVLAELDFAGLAVVVNRVDFHEQYGDGPIDESLPAHPYVLALDFLMERTLFALDGIYDGAKATVVAESRGAKEDAILQHELSRLLLDGTSYIRDSWFRQQLHPGIQFQLKKDNVTGLQLADLLARPIGEKVANPESDPPRWSLFRDKLCVGEETKNSPIGLKILPWAERYADIWKS